MIRITNGISEIEVTNGAYEGIFKAQGYKPVGGEPVVADVEEPVEEEAEDAPESTEKPLDKWNADEVKAYAAEHDIDLSGTKNIKEARALISAHMG